MPTTEEIRAALASQTADHPDRARAVRVLCEADPGKLLRDRTELLAVAVAARRAFCPAFPIVPTGPDGEEIVLLHGEVVLALDSYIACLWGLVQAGRVDAALAGASDADEAGTRQGGGA